MQTIQTIYKIYPQKDVKNMSNPTLKQLLNDYERKRNLAISIAEKKKEV